MANISRTELRKRVLTHLAVTAAGEEASAHDAALVDAQIVSAIGMLQKWGVPAWGEADNEANRLRHSEDFTAVPPWAKTDSGDTVSADAIAAPDGEASADGWIADSTDGAHGYTQSAVLTAAGYTQSAWAKAGDQDWLYLANDTIANITAYFDLANGVVGTVGSAATAEIEQWPDGWYRCFLRFTGTAASSTLRIVSASADGDATFAGDGSTVNTYVWGAQCRLTSAGDGYIKTAQAVAGFDSQVIPDFAQDALRDIVAFRCAPSFGLVARIGELAQLAQAAEAVLRRHVAAKTSYVDTKEELAYLALQAVGYIMVGEVAPAAALQAAKDGIDYEFARLTKDKIINFTTTTIPDRAMGPLADIVAYWLAPRLGRGDPASTQLLKARYDIAFGDMKAQIESKTPTRPVYVEYF